MLNSLTSQGKQLSQHKKALTQWPFIELVATILCPIVPQAAIINSCLAVMKARDYLFWTKFEEFISGTAFSEEERLKLAAKLAENENKEEFLLRLTDAIDKAISKKNMRYLSAATRAFLADYIDIQTYYRICHLISVTLPEDLEFLRNHIREDDSIAENQCVQGLASVGLMRISVIDTNLLGEQKYSFTAIAHKVDQFAISYDDTDRYPNPCVTFLPKTSSSIRIEPELRPATNEEIDCAFEKN